MVVFMTRIAPIAGIVLIVSPTAVLSALIIQETLVEKAISTRITKLIATPRPMWPGSTLPAGAGKTTGACRLVRSCRGLFPMIGLPQPLIRRISRIPQPIRFSGLGLPIPTFCTKRGMSISTLAIRSALIATTFIMCG